MSGFDYSLIPTIFIIFQAGTVGLFVLLHFFMGLKRGFFKTTWHFIGQVALVGALFYGLSFLQIADLITEESLGDLLGMIQGFGVNVSQFQEYIDMVVTSGALPLVAAIVDLVVKIVVFMLFYWILKYIFQFIFFGIPWFIIITPIVKDKTKNRILGGLMGAARGAFSGFISIFPMLILMNTITGQGVVIDDPDYQDLAAYISEANQYNAVRYINDAVQVEEKGLADY